LSSTIFVRDNLTQKEELRPIRFVEVQLDNNRSINYDNSVKVPHRHLNKGKKKGIWRYMHKETNFFPLWAIAVLVGMTIILYANGLGGKFVWDDRSLILQNPMVQNPQRAFQAFTAPFIIFGIDYGYYRPLVILSFALDQWFWNGRPLGFHVTNLALHLAVVIVLFLFLARLFDWKRSVIAAGIFATLACHTENIAFISGRMDILATLFMSICLLVYVWKKPHILALSLVLVFELCALLSKEVAFVFPLLFALCIVYLYPKKEWQRHFLNGGISIGGAFVVYFILRAVCIGKFGIPTGAAFPLAQRMLTVPKTIVLYIQLLLFPFNLNARHILVPPAGPGSLDFLGFLAILVCLTLLITFVARRAKIIAFGILWFLAGILPVLNIVPLRGLVTAERFLYLPSAGLAVFVVGLLAFARNSNQGRSIIIWLILCFVGINNAIFTVLRNPVWHDEKRFFTRMVEQTPSSPLAHHNLGYVYYRDGDWTKAEAEYRKAIALNPTFPDAHATLGDILTKTGRYQEAIEEYTTYLNIFPTAPNRQKALERIEMLKILIDKKHKGVKR
jgi:hypothetical protein